MRLFWAHLSSQILAFITFFIISALIAASLYLCVCFVYWVPPQIPSIEMLYFTGRIFVLTSLLLNLIYSRTETYRKSVLNYLA